ncbi:hypothetical protein PK35_03335 [Tamlana nanhaiensis]|uniref:DUF2383 domain-containing protein n=1 Tax=Neotamlana nanhaiensis TaxID=1382798 RepID=A0A0D7W458_9FLAO|nr:DUF2383 domain-containing protein [Tamlana nanhaiensis]KJD33799.1 hypothetical protein PK35_03335 [Tamlana nanhaiensis]
MRNTEQINKQLNRLLSVNFKAEKAFLDVIDNVESTVIKNFLRVSGYERKQFIKALDLAIRQKGGTPTYPDSIVPTPNKKSSKLRHIIAKNNKLKILTEIGKMQVTDIEKYQKVLNNVEFPEQLESALKKQKDTIVNSLYGIEVHKDLFARRLAIS